MLAQLLSLLAAYAHQARRGRLCFGGLALIRAVHRSDSLSDAAGATVGFAAGGSGGSGSTAGSSTGFAKLKRPSKVSPEGAINRFINNRLLL